MYLKTPKRYSSGYRRRNSSIFSLRRLLSIIVVIVLIVVGIGIYENREMLQPVVEEQVNNVVDSAGDQINQMRATPLPPTRDPTNDITLANNAWQRGAMEEAITYYTNAAPAMPNDLLVHYRLTMALINQGRYEEAVNRAENAITASPYAADAWAVHAMALNRVNRSTEAIASARRALELVPENLLATMPDLRGTRARALAFLADAYLNIGRTELARSTVEEAIATDPDSFEALQVRGRVSTEVDYNFLAAREDYSAAYDIGQNMPYLGIWLARNLTYRFDEYDGAISIYQDILENNPNNALVLYDLGYYYYRYEGNSNEAFNYFSRCVDADPNNAECLYRLGRTKIDDPEETIYSPQEAQQILLQAHELQPDNGYILYWLAQAHMALGQCQFALPYMENGLNIARDNEDQTLIDSFQTFALPQARTACGGGVVPPAATPTPADDGEEDANL
jgi:tetratricopeptide (TPR) repeat protein